MPETTFSLNMSIPAEYWIAGGKEFDPAEACVYIDFIQLERWDDTDESQQDIVLVDQGGITDVASDGSPSIEGAGSVHRVELYQDGVECEWEGRGDGDYGIKIGGKVGIVTDDPAIIEEISSIIDPDTPPEYGPSCVLKFNFRKTGDDPPMQVETSIEASGTLAGIDSKWGP